MTGRLPNVSPEVQEEIALLLAKGDREGASLRLRRYRSNEESAYLIRRGRSEWAAAKARKSRARALLAFTLLVLATALVVWLSLKR